jgi:hypothetical protein
MRSQQALVEIIGEFYPKIVQMDASDPRKGKRRIKPTSETVEGE